MSHRMFLTASLASTLLAAAASTAAAQPSTATSNPPPQTESWDDVSHVNGQLVPVGEKNEYLYRYRRTNISSNPIGWITGFYGVSASYGVNQHVAVRGDVNYIHPVGSDMEMTELGVGAPLYLRRTYQGPFVEPGFIVRHGKDCDSCETESTLGPQVLVGWHRTWDSGFNISAAVGAGRDLAQEEDDFESDDELFFNGYFRIGYAF